MFKKLIFLFLLFVSTTIYALSSEQADYMYQIFQRYGYDVVAIFNERAGELIINNLTDTNTRSKYSSLLFTNLGLKAYLKFITEASNYDYTEIKTISFRTGQYEARIQKVDLDYLYLITQDRFRLQSAVNTLVDKIYAGK